MRKYVGLNPRNVNWGNPCYPSRYRVWFQVMRVCKGYLDDQSRAVACSERPPGRQHRCPPCKEAHQRRSQAKAQADYRARQRALLLEMQETLTTLSAALVSLQEVVDNQTAQLEQERQRVSDLERDSAGLVHRVSDLERWRQQRQWWRRVRRQLTG